MSNRKPHNINAGYIAEKQYNGAHIVIYNAEEAGIDTGMKYAIVCEKHNRIVGATSMPKARSAMKSPDFCEECMKRSAADQVVARVMSQPTTPRQFEDW